MVSNFLSFALLSYGSVALYNCIISTRLFIFVMLNDIKLEIHTNFDVIYHFTGESRKQISLCRIALY